TSHKSEFINIGVGWDLKTPVNKGSIRVLVKGMNIERGKIVANLNVFLYEREPVSWHKITFKFEKQDFQTGIAYYIRLGSTLVSNSTNFVTMVPNRVKLYG